MIRTREVFTHHYRKVRPARVREIVEHSLPSLIATLERLDLPDLEEAGD
jgi:uncharacterized protein with HEPN domain